MNMVYEIRWFHGQPKAWYKLTLNCKVYNIILQWFKDVALDHFNDDTMGKVVYRNQGFEFSLIPNYTTTII